MTTAIVREFRPGEEAALHSVFYSAVREVASRDYTSDQIAAWAPVEWDRTAWAARIRGIRPFVAEVDGEPVGYADVQANGYVDHFFVAAPWVRRGVGGTLMEKIHLRASDLGIKLLWSDVSRTAQPFFSRFGFRVVRESSAVIRGITVPNARMEKHFEG